MKRPGEAISGSRERKGNFIVEGLLDDYLNLAGQAVVMMKLTTSCEMLSYEGQIEEQKAGDHFTSDLIRFYKHATPSPARPFNASAGARKVR